MNEIWGGLNSGGGGGGGYYWNFTVCSVCSVSGEMSRGRKTRQGSRFRLISTGSITHCQFCCRTAFVLFRAGGSLSEMLVWKLGENGDI